MLLQQNESHVFRLHQTYNNDIEIVNDVMCVCVFIFFHREGFFRLQDVQDILEGTDQHLVL